MAVITLLTDYGLTDTYVGQVKGAILSVAPDAAIVDLTHAVPPQNVFTGAFLLWTAVEAFVPGTIHLAVVDPGVGTARRPIALRARRGDLLVGPDNGLLVPACERLGGIDRAVELTEARFHGARRSTTFHGRDVFGPVAGHLANGISLEQLGSSIEDLDRSIGLPRAKAGRGEVIHIDGFGNLVTSFWAEDLPPRFSVEIAGRIISGAPHPHFQAVGPRGLAAIIGSSGLLEICQRDGNAASMLGVGLGEPVVVKL